MNTKKQTSHLIFFTLLIFLSACGSNEKLGEKKESAEAILDAEQVMHLTVESELATTDTVLVAENITFAGVNQFIEGLYRLDENNKPIPALAESEDISEDGLTYTFHLRNDAKWSNGEPVTAHDFVFSWRRNVDPTSGAAYAYLFEDIKNASDIMAEQLPLEELGVKALDDTTLEVTLETPIAYFPSLMSFVSFFPQNEAFVRNAGNQYGTSSETTLTNGPFLLSEWDNGLDESWNYEKNPAYWDAENVHLTKITNQVIKDVSTGVNLFEKGDVDNALLSGEYAKQFQKNPSYTVEYFSRTNYLEVNQTDNPYLKNETFRKALALAINREELTSVVLNNGSLPINGLVPDHFVKNPESGTEFAEEAGDFYTYDLPEAQKLVEEAKAELGVDTIELELLGDDDETSKRVMEYLQGEIQNNLEGVNITLLNVPFSARLAKAAAGDFDLISSGWSGYVSDPMIMLDVLYSTSSYNNGGYSNEKVDQLIDDAKGIHANEPSLRWADMLKAHQIALDDAALIPLYQKGEAMLRNPKIKNVNINSVGARYSYKDAYIID
ncbi:dipeptide-binding protein DppE [Carnobacterium sp. 17-4]|uniref:peptide ABC transporter substrate-binding protein n=1 Tax=Carnobacterium sp. (strain 17-4) TaxID=208596 RepID=UPI0002058509|nr:peptide ABC transporter substrate-binding protein [Carnobacterium sp. 17-4]AEB30440.1 dipeptide-binding protein DppE [Carnobacterium sp. 17-4]